MGAWCRGTYARDLRIRWLGSALFIDGRFFRCWRYMEAFTIIWKKSTVCAKLEAKSTLPNVFPFCDSISASVPDCIDYFVS